MKLLDLSSNSQKLSLDVVQQMSEAECVSVIAIHEKTFVQTVYDKTVLS